MWAKVYGPALQILLLPGVSTGGDRLALIDPDRCHSPGVSCKGVPALGTWEFNKSRVLFITSTHSGADLEAAASLPDGTKIMDDSS